MAAAIPFITLAVAAGSATVSAVQNADAQGEQQKQQAAQEQEDQNLLASQQAQENQMTQEQQSNAQRDAQLAQEQTVKEQQGSTVSPDPSYSGPSVFGSPGYAVSGKGNSLFGGV